MKDSAKHYNFLEIEQKWQAHWEKEGAFKAIDFSDKPKYYALVEFPYPSGAGMHVGHIRAYMSLEVIARKRRMEGYNVLFPMGFDAFGLPTENYAIKENIHPRVVTDQNIENFTHQLKKVGFSFDYDRMVDTTDPNYYKWTQWIFIKLFKAGLAYRSKTYVNYCPSCQVVLANEESQGGVCDRCGEKVIQKEKDVWFLKITAYAEKLLEGLKGLETLPRIKTEQEHWIGKSIGANVTFKIEHSKEALEVFTTRPDTLFGATFMVIAPEHPVINTLKDQITNLDAVHAYQKKATEKSAFERVELAKEKTGVKLEGLEAINPVNQEKIPIFVADYVMMDYGTGAIMAVPGHDERDYAFAKKFGCPIVEVIAGGDISQEAYTDTEHGILVNSGLINGLSVKEAKEKIITWLEEHKVGQKAIQYKMKDWAFNRQRYWGEPIPVIHSDGEMIPYPEEDLPLVLPNLTDFKPSAEGESPLAKAEDWIQYDKNGIKGRLETDTMPQWAGSSWYFLRYIDPHNKTMFADKEKLKYWLPVDWYNGGMEHVTRHVIYSRFWHRFLYDQGYVPTPEPYKKRSAQGLILGPDGDKMSKSKGNVVNPMDVVERYGADTLRVYILFIGDYEQATPWSESGVKGAKRFLDKVYRLQDIITEDEDNKDLIRLLHQTIAAVDADMEAVKFNTAIAKLMTFVNEAMKQEKLNINSYLTFLKLLNPFAPHLAEELYTKVKNESLVFASYPKANSALMQESQVTIVISINGKVRDKIEVAKDLDEETLKEMALKRDKVQGHLNNMIIVKWIMVPDKLINIVVRPH
jgi:leucyl-tRNA synthetase